MLVNSQRSKTAKGQFAGERLRAAVSPVAAAFALFACQAPEATVDVGSVWVATGPRLAAMHWTSDARTLLYDSLDGELSAVQLGSSTPRVLVRDVYAIHLVETSSGDVVFFLRPVAGANREFECMQASLLGGELGTPRLIATAQTYGDFVVSAHGEAVALPVSDGALVVDTATGAARAVPIDMPIAFAPDAASLFGRKGSEHVMIDASGAVTPLLDATRASVVAVTRWDANSPSAVIVDKSYWLDVPSGEKRPLLPGLETNARSFAGVSGDTLRPEAAYVWSEECLSYATVGQPPVAVCSEPQVTLARVDLETRAVRSVASMPEIRRLAVSPDSRQLATYDDDASHGGTPHIDLKELPPL